jgi:branched-chain amino acid transport system substrate-binding protein
MTTTASAEPGPGPGGAVLRVGAAGEVVVVEAGDPGDVPGSLLRLAAGALVTAAGELRVIAPGPPDLRVLVRPGEATVLLATEPVEALPHGLSRRELDVLTLLVAGLPNAGIARRLAIGARTVGTHVDRVLRKLGVEARAAAATRALDEGLVVVPLPGGTAGFEHLRLGRALAAAVLPSPGRRSRRRPGPVRRRPLRLGAAVPLTGVAAGDGQEMVRGARLAVEEINAAGGVGGRSVDLRVTDVDPQDADAVRRGFGALLDDDVDVLTSGYLARQDVAHDVAAASGVPYLHAATSGLMEERVRGDPARFARVFQVCPSDVHYGPHFVAYVSRLRDRGLWRPSSRRLTVLAQDSWELIDFGLDRAAELAAAAGWELVVETPPGGHWAAAGAAAAVGDAAAVMVGSYLVDDHVAFVEGFRAAPAPSPSLVYAIYAPSVPEFRARLGRRADGILWATTTGTYPDRLGHAFASRYTARFGVLPGRSHAGIAYDRTRLVADAWASADFRDFGAVAARLRAGVHRGVNGSYAFDGPGQTAYGWEGEVGGDPSLAQAHLVHQIQDGRHRVVSPRPYADGAFRTPPWITGREVTGRSG